MEQAPKGAEPEPPIRHFVSVRASPGPQGASQHPVFQKEGKTAASASLSWASPIPNSRRWWDGWGVIAWPSAKFRFCNDPRQKNGNPFIICDASRI